MNTLALRSSSVLTAAPVTHGVLLKFTAAAAD
ncbi:hypothetical protein RDI58_009984 [Solanum bulbocastanum]|uniref:Uncharacterized protein n=1 Tax=Solanum bulbocastanum TaxID=147425 RepID=A0AAN8YJ05_SOLBU